MAPGKTQKNLHRNLFNGDEESGEENDNPTLANALKKKEEAPAPPPQSTNAYGIARADVEAPKPKPPKARYPSIRPKAVFRCIPGTLKTELDQLAAELNVPMGYLAYYLFETGLGDFHAGRLPIQSHLTVDGYTLYPDEHRRAGRPLKNAKPKKEKLVGFHGVPKDIVNEIAQIAEQILIPQGEVARRLIEYGIEKHRSRTARISPNQLAEFVYAKVGRR